MYIYFFNQVYLGLLDIECRKRNWSYVTAKTNEWFLLLPTKRKQLKLRLLERPDLNTFICRGLNYFHIYMYDIDDNMI